MQTTSAGKLYWPAYGLTRQDLEEPLYLPKFAYSVSLISGSVAWYEVEKNAIIAAYYQDKFLPEVRKRNAAEPKLAEVSAKIEQILAEQRVDAMLTNWLKTLRAQAHIEKMLPAPGRGRCRSQSMTVKVDEVRPRPPPISA